MSSQDFHKEFEFAKKIIPEAGKIVMSYFNSELTISHKEDNTIVTQADQAVEKFIRTSLEEEFPEHGFIGEETDENNKETAWVVDPIDGTVAFSRGICDFGVAIGFKQGNNVVFSVMYVPYSHEEYSAYQGEGAFRNGEKLSVSSTSDLRKSIISLASGNILKKDYHNSIVDLLYVTRVRMGLSAVIESGHIAAGRSDLLAKFSQSIWDVVPEYLLMKEAGAVICNEYGEELTLDIRKGSKTNYIAATKSLPQEQLQDLYLVRTK